MKLIEICVVMLFGSSCGGQIVQMTFQVRDDFGRPVAGASVGFAEFVRWEPGEGFGKNVYKNVDQLTDKNGLATVRGSSPQLRVSYGIDTTEGYYYTGGGVFVFKFANEGRWQPWNPTVNIVLKPIVNPVPMYAKRVTTNIPRPDQKYGFDLLVGDWIKPVGKGITPDIVFEVTGYANSVTDVDSTLTVSFGNPQDGIQPFTPTPGCEFRSPREAPLDGYQPRLVFRRARKPGQLSPDQIDETAHETNYLFRVRTRLDEKGKIKSALYGKIYGGFDFGAAVTNCGLKIGSYYLNPEPNSRNMEFDPKRNLFRNLGPFEEVNEP